MELTSQCRILFTAVSILLLVLGLTPTSALADDPACTPTSRVCAGDAVYVLQAGKLVLGRATEVAANGSIQFAPVVDGKPVLPAKQIQMALVAGTRVGPCKAERELCPGEGEARHEGGKPVSGVVVAKFPSGNVVVIEPNGKPLMLGAGSVKSRQMEEQDRELLASVVQEFERIQALVGLEPEKPCDGECEVPKSPAPAKAIKLRCNQNPEGKWLIQNSAGVWVGKGGWTAEADCMVFALKSPSGDVICSYNGNTFQLYHSETGKPIGSHPPEFGYLNSPSGAEQCISHAKMQPTETPFVCAWTGDAYAPHYRPTNRRIGHSSTGWTEMKDCVKEALPGSHRFAVCGWNGKSYAAYSPDGTQGPSFAKSETCQAEVKSLAALKSKTNVKRYLRAFHAVRDKAPEAFVNGKPDKNVGFSYWKSCGVREDAWHLTKSDEDGYLVPECQPDTLYSWGDAAKLQWFNDNLGDGKAWPQRLPRSLFTTATATGTLGYGDYPIRFKLKSGVKFKVARNQGWRCEDFLTSGLLKESELSTTVVARVEKRNDGFSFLEFIVCSPRVIESWSHGTQEALDEMVREYAWITTHDHKEWEGYSKRNGVDDYISNNVDAGAALFNTDFSAGTYARRMWFNRIRAEYGLGGVRFPEKATRSTEQHFQTSRPSFFNPN